MVFEPSEADQAKIEATLKEMWPKLLGFTGMTIVRSYGQLDALAKTDLMQVPNIAIERQIVSHFL